MYHRKIETDGLTYSPAGGRKRHEQDVVKRYLPLVRKIAWHVHGGHSSTDIEDLIQIGLIALIEAWRVFEEKGANFSTYATTRIRGAMIDHQRKSATVSRRGMANRRMLENARRQLELSLGRAASHPELAAHLGLTVEQYYEIVESAQALKMESLEDSYSDSNLFFADLAETAGSGIEQEQLLGQLEGCIANLNEREALILQLYFIEQQNLSEIAETLNIGSARVCQIKKRALEKIREDMNSLNVG